MCRKCLLDKYVLRWLFALHCQDPGTYSTFLFDAISDLALESSAEDIVQQSVGEENKVCHDQTTYSHCLPHNFLSFLRQERTNSYGVL